MDYSKVVTTDENGEMRITPLKELYASEDMRLIPQFSKILPQTHFIPYRDLVTPEFACQETINAIYFFDKAFGDCLSCFSDV